MCLATSEPGGPRRCSGDTLRAFESAVSAVGVLEGEALQLRQVLAETSGAAEASSRSADDVSVAPPAAPKLFAEKEGRAEKIRAEIDDAVERLGTAGAWQDYLDVAQKFPHHSFRNQILIYLQCPQATRVAGGRAWQTDHNRRIRAGSKAIWIQAPMFRKKVDPETGEETRELFGFKPVPVFDVSQTEGDPLPEPPPAPVDLEGDAPVGMIDDLAGALERRGFSVSYEDLGPELKGYTTFGEPKRVVINSRGSGSQRAKTLAHELAHVELGHGKRSAEYHSRPGGERPDMEVEAESTAYVVSKAYGLETGSYSFGYIDNWARGDTDRVKATAAAVVKGAAALLSEFNR